MMRYVCTWVMLCWTGSAWAQTNLIANGDFESGNGTGWTAWGAGWGSNNPPEFNSTEPGRIGNHCLKLSTASQHSFGVYQQITVIPGTTYEFKAYWKGKYFGGTNWYECLLIDGPFTLDAADNPNLNQLNKMYAYDEPNNPMTADFGWEWTDSLDGTAADWNGYQGRRTATGTVMTVVLKAGACCGSTGAQGFWDNVSLVAEGEEPPPGGSTGGCALINGGFAEGMTGWTPWVERDDNNDFEAAVVGGEMRLRGSDFNAGVYQQFDVGGPGHVVNVMGRWRSDVTLLNSMWAEVWAIQGNRVPVDGVDEIDGVNGAVLLYKTDTFNGRGPWNGALPFTSPVHYRSSVVATGSKMTLLLKTGNVGPYTFTSVRFDDLSVECVPDEAAFSSLPAGFVGRQFTFGTTAMVSLAQSPTSRQIYAINNASNATDTRLYRIDVAGQNLAATQISGLNNLVDYAQGLAFDAAGHLYISNQYGKIIKGTDTHASPAVDNFSFSQILAMPPLQLGTFHGVGGIAVGPDQRLYINSGSESHYGYYSNGQLEPFAGRLNARILRCELNGSNLATFCEGIRNTFDISFRSDGKLFGVENGPNTGCDYAEEFNLLEPGKHYGFPYKYGSDLSGSDSSLTCTSVGHPGPPALPAGLVVTPAWANLGPDGKPGPGEPGYANGGVYYGFDGHSSPDGLDFYEPELMDPAAIKFPAAFHGRAFVGRFGNLENVPSVGYDVVTLRLNEVNNAFFTNRFLKGLGRTIDVLCAHNGRVYVLEYNPQTSFNGAGWGGGSRLYEIAYTVSPEPIITLSRSTIQHTLDLGELLPDDVFSVTNTGGATLEFDIESDAPWLLPSPVSGQLAPGETAQLITLGYDLHGVTVGSHAATLTVSDRGGQAAVRTIDVQLTIEAVLPDYDDDTDVDLTDFAKLQACLSDVPGGPVPTGCTQADLDGDATVGPLDVGLFVGCMSGQAIPANSGCLQ